MNIRDPLAIPDVQSSEDRRKLAIDQVGIKAIRHPVRVAERSGGTQHTIATFNMYVGLPHHFKGTHMSRFVEILNAHEREISPQTFQVILEEMVERLEAESGRIEKCFKMKVVVPVTSLCPCSKRISDYGAHNQRSHVTISARTKGFVWIEELVDYAEKHASSELYGLLK